jgi:hypothetical protein
VYNVFILKTREERNYCSLILRRLASDGVIEKYGNKKGVYRVINDDCKEVAWQNATDVSLPIQWPFGIEKLVDIMPGNIVVLAGESNAGKTAFLLNLMKINMDSFDIHYFNSEMGAEEMKRRISNFEDIKPHEWNFHFYERSGDFADVIRPNGFNIIDFLEVHDEFWKVGGIIREIHDKLDRGICIIAIQKDKMKEIGKGGAVTLEKPRLYMNMRPGELKIIKAKNWHSSSVNPNGMSIIFKVVNGSKLYTAGSWERKAA